MEVDLGLGNKVRSLEKEQRENQNQTMEKDETETSPSLEEEEEEEEKRREEEVEEEKEEKRKSRRGELTGISRDSESGGASTGGLELADLQLPVAPWFD